MRVFFQRALKTALAALLAGATAGTFAAIPSTWKNVPYAYNADRSTLGRVLNDFAGNFGVNLTLPDELANVKVAGRIVGESPADFLDMLSLAYKFRWFVYNDRLYISTLDDNAVERLQVGVDGMTDLKDALTGIGLYEQKFGWGELPEAGIVLVTGPKEYIKLVRDLVGMDALKRPDEPEVMVFRLKHANADDREIQFRDKTITTPGVATILTRLLQDQGRRSSTRRGPETRSTTSMLSSLLPDKPSASNGSGLGSLGSLGSAESGNASGASAVSTAVVAASRDSNANRRTVSVEADVRTNSVIIRDLPSKREYYKALIEEFDKPERLVEIEATIVDVDISKLNELGIDWSLGRNVRVQSSTGGSAGSVGPDMAGTLTGTLVIQNLDRFFARIRALESTGDAQILAKPAVTTMNNLSAVLDLSRTAYMPLVGERVADLREVTAGTMLKVLPRVTGEDDDLQVQMSIDIQDGDLKAEAGATTPTVIQASISTQAVVDNEESLVIGGYNLNAQRNTRDKVPGLGDLPLLGRLFSSNHVEHNRRERLFIITPRVVTMNRKPPKRSIAEAQMEKSYPEALARMPKKAEKEVPAETNEPKQDSAAAKEEAPATSAEPAQPASAVPTVADANPVLDMPPVPAWEIAASDRTIRTSLARWAGTAGWQLRWEAPVDYPVEAAATVSGTFEEAVESVVRSMEAADIPLKAIFYQGNKVLRIVTKGG